MVNQAGLGARSVLLVGALLVSALVTTVISGGQAAIARRVVGPAELISTTPGADDYLLPTISGDGNVVAYAVQPAPGTFARFPGIFVRDRAAGSLDLAPPADGTDTGGELHPVLSRNGCVIAFWAHFDNGGWSVFKWDRCAGTAPVPVLRGSGHDPTQATYTRDLAVSDDGRFIAAIAAIPGLAGDVVMRIDTLGGANTVADGSAALLQIGFRYITSVDISDDGQFIAVAAAQSDNRTPLSVIGWTPGTSPAAVVSQAGGVVAAGSSNFAPSVSQDGRFVAFISGTQAVVRDRAAGVNKPVAAGAIDLDMNPSATQIAYTSRIGRNPSQINVAYSTSGAFDAVSTELVTVGPDGSTPLTALSAQPAISATGRYVAFATNADAELGPFPADGHVDVYLRERPPGLSTTPEVNFGTIAIGATSNPGNAVVTNTSTVVVQLGAVAPPAAPFSVAGDGCSGVVLLPGQSCAITLLYRPTAAGTNPGQVSVSGEGIAVSTQLRGAASANPPPTAPPTVPPTVPPTQTTPRPTPTTARPVQTTTTVVVTTTLPPPVLSIAPAVIDFGSVLVGSTTPTQDFTLTNTGGSPVTIETGALSGDSADQFAFDLGACIGQTLSPGASCAIPAATSPTHGGASEATLVVSGSQETSALATLRVGGSFTPTLRVSPGVLRPGDVGRIVGAGFPPNAVVQLTLDTGAPMGSPTTDGSGAFTIDLVLFPNDPRIGGKVLLAADQPGLFAGVRTTFLIELGTFKPSGSVTPAITSGIRSQVISRSG